MVYVIFESWTCGDSNGNNIQVFTNYNSAKEYFNILVKSAKKDSKNFGYNRKTFSSDLFEVWLDGEYNSEHITIQLLEKRLQRGI